LNESIILKTIRRMGAISRADIAKITGQNPSTLTNITGKLLENNVILEHHSSESSGGRKPLLLRMNPDIANVIIINIHTYTVCCHIADAAGNLIVPKRDYWFKKNQDEVLADVLLAISDALKLTTAPVLGIAIIVRGPVKTKEGISIYAPNIGWRNVPIKFIVEERFGITTLVENDVRILTIGMYYYTLRTQSQNMVLLKVGQGIGAGIITNGQLYKGDNETAGEIGHMTLDIHGPKCSCGRRGCLDVLSSEIALVNYVNEAIAEGKKSFVTELEKIVEREGTSRLQVVEKGTVSNTHDLIYQAAIEGDKVCLEALDKVAFNLGIGVANLINIFNPETVVIAGGLMRVQNLIKEQVENVAREYLLDYCFSTGKMYFSNRDEEANIKGAVDMVLSAELDS
jgi:N-acetylglucosamine repressor